MHIDLTEEQTLLRDTCRDFAARELTPYAKKWDREHYYPREAVKKAFELGLAGVAIPPEWGGSGMAIGVVGTVAQRWLKAKFGNHVNVPR